MRALAIFLVIAVHLSERFALGVPRSGRGIAQYFVLGCGVDGVGIFFVLSGFLISSLLVKEFRAYGAISLPDFYLRRVFRILPPLYLYLLFAVFFCTSVEHSIQWQPILSAAFFYKDYAPVHESLLSQSWMTQHTWSLSVEEQFYILWPPTLSLMLNRRGPIGAAKLAAGLVLVTPVLRIATKLSHLLFFRHRLMFLLHTRMDALMCGCLIALLLGEPRFERFFAWISRIWWVLPLEIFVLSPILKLTFRVDWIYTFGLTVDAASVALFLLWVARNEQSIIGGILNSRLMVGAGVLSYSAYLWQTFFLHEANPTWTKHMPWCLVWIWGAAAISYVLIERPALQMRHRIQKKEKIQELATLELSRRDSSVQPAD